MKVPLLDLKEHIKPLRDELASALLEVLDSTQYILGPKVEELEHKLATYCNSPHAITVSSGTDALLLSLMALDVGHDDLVLTSDYSFFATAGAIARLNATPIFLDIDPDSYNIDPNAISDWFKKNPEKIKKVKAIIPVHLYGQCADMKPIMELAKKYNIPVIEDAAQAIGSRYPYANNTTQQAGTMGNVGCFSFFPSKNLGGIGDGGFITCQDDKLADKIRLLRNHGAKPKYYHQLIGGNFRLDPIQAAVLLVKLPHLDTWHKARQENAKYYTQNLTNLPLKTPKFCYGLESHIFNQYVVSIPYGRDQLKEFLTNNEIGTEVYYPVPFHKQECFKYLRYATGTLPNSEYAAEHTLAIPVFPELKSEQREYVVAKVKEFYAEANLSRAV